MIWLKQPLLVGPKLETEAKFIARTALQDDQRKIFLASPVTAREEKNSKAGCGGCLLTAHGTVTESGWPAARLAMEIGRRHAREGH